MSDLSGHVLDAIQHYNMIEQGELVLVAVSGGPDSLALLHILNCLRSRLSFQLHVAHLEHGFRGRESLEEANWVQETAAAWGVPCTVAHQDVPALAKERGLSAQEAGHLARKAFFFDLLKKLGAQKIALGHHADDQAETLLMHFLKGSGTRGLCGMLPVNAPIIRPLLFLRRAEIEEYCREKGLEPRRDPSNNKDIYLRNRIRHRLIPVLSTQYNPNLVDTLSKTARILWEEENYLQAAVKEKAESLIACSGKRVKLELQDWQNTHLAIQRRLIRLAYHTQAGGRELFEDTDNGEQGAQGLSFDHVEEIRRLILDKQVGKKVQLPGMVTVEKGYAELWFCQTGEEPHRKVAAIPSRELLIPGRTPIPETGQVIIAEVHQGVSAALGDNSKKDRVSSFLLPWIAGKTRIFARSRRMGDRLFSEGKKGGKKLKDLFIEKKIPRHQRDGYLLITDEHSVLWVPQLAIGKGPFLPGKEEGAWVVLRLEENDQGDLDSNENSH